MPHGTRPVQEDYSAEFGSAHSQVSHQLVLSLDAIPSVSSLNFIRDTGLEAGVVGGDTRPL